MRRYLLLGLPLVLLAALSVAVPGAIGQANPTVRVAHSATAGSYLVNPQGMTLYTLSADSPGVSTCDINCTLIWPPLLQQSGDPTAGSGVTGTLGVIVRSDGGRQVTYNGMPLYTYIYDRMAGDTSGDGVTDAWGTWSLAAP